MRSELQFLSSSCQEAENRHECSVYLRTRESLSKFLGHCAGTLAAREQVVGERPVLLSRQSGMVPACR